MRGTLRVFALVPLLVCAVAPASAGVDRWTPLSSIVREAVVRVVFDPERSTDVYAVAGSELWKSWDLGASWMLLRNGLDPYASGRRDLGGPVFDPADSRRLWVWAGDFLWFSADAGGHWTLRKGWTDLDLSAGGVLPDPIVPERLLSLTEDGRFLVSDDGGATWTTHGRLPGPAPRTRLFVDPSDQAVLYAPAPSALFRSGDGGTTWSAWSDFDGSGFAQLAIAPSRPSVLYAVPFTAPGELLRSTDGGRSWSATNLPEPRLQVGSLLIDPVDDRRVRVIVLRNEELLLLGSHDGGATWTDPERPVPTRTEPGLFFPTVVSDPANPRTLLAVPDLAKSRDGGTTWRSVGREIQGGSVDSMAVTVWGGHALLFAATFDRDHQVVARSRDGGSTWHRLSAPELWLLAADPHRPSRIWGAGLGIHRSDDRGGTWHDVTPPGLDSPSDLLVDRVQPRRVFVATLFGGVWRTEDAGATWVQSTTGLPLQDDCHLWRCPQVGPVAVDAGAADHVFVVVDGGLYRSTDGGDSWRRMGADLPWTSAVATHPTRPGTIYAGTVDGVSASADGGRTWSRIPGFAGDVRRLLVDPATDQVYAATREGVFRWPRRAYGDWESLDTGLAGLAGPGIGLGGLIADPASPGRIYTLVPALGIWTGRFVDGDALKLATGRFEVRVALADGRVAAAGVPWRLSASDGFVSVAACSAPELLVELVGPVGGDPFVQVVAAGLTRREVELTVTDRLSGVARTYRAARGEPGAVRDARAFPAYPFTPDAEPAEVAGDPLAPRAGTCSPPQVPIGGGFCGALSVEDVGGPVVAAAERMLSGCGTPAGPGALFRLDGSEGLALGVRLEPGPKGFALFYAALTDRPWQLVLSDRLTGVERVYSGTGRPVSRVEEEAFPRR